MRKKKAEVIEELEEIKEEPIEEVKETKEVPDYCLLKIGETLEDVAKKFGLEVEKLKELNGDVIGGNQIKLK